MTTPPRPQTPPPASRQINPQNPPPPKPAAEREHKAAEHEAEHKAEAPHIEDREATPFDDPDMQTVQEEQLERSAEIEEMGVEAWKAAHDERQHPEQHPDTHGRAVPGVSPTQKDDPGGRR